MAFLELTHVKKTFGRGMNQVHALRDINLTVERGSFVAIMGESGAGKSTLLNIIATLTPATAGTVTLAGHDITTLNEAARAKSRAGSNNEWRWPGRSLRTLTLFWRTNQRAPLIRKQPKRC